MREPDGGETVERARPVAEPRPIHVAVDANGLPARIGEGAEARRPQRGDAPPARVATDWWTETRGGDRTHHPVTLADGAPLECVFRSGDGRMDAVLAQASTGARNATTGAEQ